MKRITITLHQNLAELLEEEARRRGTSVAALARELLTHSLCAVADDQPREIPWAGIVDLPDGPPARELDEVLSREWHDDARSAGS